MKTIIIAVTVLLTTAVGSLAVEMPQATISVYNFVVTAPSSPSNTLSLQNAMDYTEKDGVIGLISTDVANNPAALNRPHILRACDIIYSAPSYYMWDATNGPTGNFATQNGKRLAWTFKWKSDTEFLASDIYFQCWSSDGPNSLNFTGNIATNAANGSALTFSSTLQGKRHDALGNEIAWYHNGESVATNQIDELIGMIREGYYAADSSILPLDLNYFKNYMTMTANVRFYMLNGQEKTASLSSKPYLNIVRGPGNFGTITLEGQRQLGMTYTVFGSPIIDKPTPWEVIDTDVTDGYTYTGTYYPNGFFRTMEGRIIPALTLKVSAQVQIQNPLVQIFNGPE